MRRVFADTHFYFALLNRRDPSHGRAVTLHQERFAEVITTAWVLAELADGLSSRAMRGRCVAAIGELRRLPEVRIIEADAALFWRGFDLYQSRQDKEWSLTDCISFLVMADAGLHDALTGDHHFEQAGFAALLLADG